MKILGNLQILFHLRSLFWLHLLTSLKVISNCSNQNGVLKCNRIVVTMLVCQSMHIASCCKPFICTCIHMYIGDRLSERSVISSWVIIDDVWSRIEKTSWASHAAQSNSFSTDNMEEWTWQKNCILAFQRFYY